MFTEVTGDPKYTKMVREISIGVRNNESKMLTQFRLVGTVSVHQGQWWFQQTHVINLGRNHGLYSAQYVGGLAFLFVGPLAICVYIIPTLETCSFKHLSPQARYWAP